MKDEIKEILDKLKNKDNDIKGINFLKYQDLTRGEINLLLDYITNLQQENKYLKKQNDEKTKIGVADHKYASQMEDKVIMLQEENEKLLKQLENVSLDEANIRADILLEQQDYKSKIDKAIEYIDKQKKKMYKSRNKIALFILMKLENILQNGGDN